jgi:hypothetical protein
MARGGAMLLALLCCAQAAQQPMPIEEFKERAVPLVRRFIFLKYERFRASELTFRHLKQHLADKLGMTYEQLKADEYSSVVEDTTDEIANECNMGEVAIEECKKRIGYVDGAKDEV